MLDPESQIWGAESTASARTESVRDRLSVVQPVPEKFYERCTHGIAGDRCDVCRAIRERDAAKVALAAVQPLTASAPPQCSSVVSAFEPVPRIVEAAQELAQAINTCGKLKHKIIGLEAALEFARTELATAEAARISAHDALLKLVDEE